MPPPALIVIGASAGGVEALRQLVAGLDRDIPAAVFVVLHIPPRGTSVLPAILKRAGRLPATHAADGDPIEAARIYVAPPDYHLLVNDDRMFLRRGPQEHGTRPAIDPLFRSAAEAHSERVIGVVLSGTLDDGTSGLVAIKRNGGLALVQDPDDAQHDGMPRSALATVEVDRVLPAVALAAELNELARRASQERAAKVASHSAGARTEEAMNVATEMEAEGKLAGISCPHCNGSLWEIEEEGHVHFRCRVGHQYGTESLLAAQAAALEAALWTAVRSLEETSATARRLADRIARISPGKAVERHLRKAAQAEEHAAVIRRLLQALEAALPPE